MRLILITVAWLLSACSANIDDSNLYRLSDRFGVCARLPEGASYKWQEKRIDFDLGELTIGDKRIGVYIGQQPAFDTRPLEEKLIRDVEGFQFVGKELSGGEQKILWGNKRYTHRGPLFVMFHGPGIGSIDGALTREHLLLDCLPSNW
jgi:hypothetical protein